MPNIPRVGDMEVKQDLEFQRREWVAQRVGWALMALVVLAGLLGLLGSGGPLSNASAHDEDGAVRVEYERFLHRHSPTTLRAHVAAGVAEKGEVRLWLDLEYLARGELQRVTPEPARVEAGPDRHTFVFRMADADRPTTVTFHFEADRPGPLAGRVGAGDREPARFRQFVYP
jgi:hypothetical protein